MTNLTETNNFDVGVYELQTADIVQGGPGGVSNAPAQNLTNRTRWLYSQIASILASIANLAGINSPGFTGSPTAPNVAAGDNSQKIANTAFVQGATNGISTVNVAGNTNVALTQAQWGTSIIILTGALTGNIAVIFPSQSGQWEVQNNTSGAFTVTCKTAPGAGVVVTQGKAQTLYGDGASIYSAFNDFNNVALTGAPSAPTPATNDNSTKVATTAFVQAAVEGADSIIQFTGSGTYTTGPLQTTAFLTGVAPGGPGGGACAAANSFSNAGGGGSSGQFVYRYPVTVTPNTTYAVTIASAGAPGASGGGNGANSGALSFGSLLTLTGGAGGSGGSGSYPGVGGASVGRGSAAGQGGNGIDTSTATTMVGGSGGPSPFGSYGAGGPGGAATNTPSAPAGAAGGAGVLWVET